MIIYIIIIITIIVNIILLHELQTGADAKPQHTCPANIFRRYVNIFFTRHLKSSSNFVDSASLRICLTYEHLFSKNLSRHTVEEMLENVDKFAVKC